MIRFYVRSLNETVEKAIKDHTDGGFESYAEARSFGLSFYDEPFEIIEVDESDELDEWESEEPHVV